MILDILRFILRYVLEAGSGLTVDGLIVSVNFLKIFIPVRLCISTFFNVSNPCLIVSDNFLKVF